MTSYPPPVMPTPRRLVTRYGVTYCLACNLAIEFCRCPPRPIDDRDEQAAQADLKRRIADVVNNFPLGRPLP